MLTMKIRSRKVFLAMLLFLSSLSGCANDPIFWIVDETRDDEQYTDYDSRELEEQITDYWRYEEISGKKQEEIMEKVEAWETRWITAGEYVVGEDIEAGIYIACPYEEDIYVAEQGNMDKRLRYWEFWYNDAFYLKLVEEDIIYLTGESKIALADESSPSLAAMEDNVYYEGTYQVGEELPEGEYFVIDYSFGGDVTTERENNRFSEDTRFWYIWIEDSEFVNVSGCVLFPMENKPEIHPIKYQGTGAGEGQYVYPNGSYKIGLDIPLGTYQLKNELFPKGNNGLDAVGYHGNVTSYYPSGLNWCGLGAGGGYTGKNITDLMEYRRVNREKLGWDSIELDNRVTKRWRSILIERTTSEGRETSQQWFWGLPTVTFTEEQIGCCIYVKKCILIPWEE